MSGKLTLDTDAGGSVTLTVDDTETGDINYPLDSAGIESGSNANGNYAKYPDGTLMQWGTSTATATTSTAQGSIFISPNTEQTFPIVFFSEPESITFTTTDIVGSASWAGYMAGEGVDVFYWNIFSTTGTGSAQVMWQAIGRWK